ncbi:lipopolysaccharide biosynthesis protein [Halorarum salinum]|uniref:Oligosaccharide flippase family protein n=1 Tax=Halorarum salinum TaxID=2743089 RepID=A0A7D5Q941_9EURY|nr:oligosaccharide flippase family protein [Halobaculum salinum]QLG60419.1 oligosaccharide flippase family protein [Halobaculum salinum]
MAAATANLSIRRESLISAASNVVLVAVHLATLALLTRALGSTGLGAYFYAISASFIAIIPSRELSEIMRKRASEVDSSSAEFFGLAQAGTALYLIAFAGALLLAAPTLVARTPLTGPTVLAFGVYTAVLTQSAMSTRLYDAAGSPGASMVAQSLRETAFLGGVLALVWFGAASPRSVLLLGAGIHLSAALCIYVLVGLVPRLPSRESLASGAEFGKWSFPTGIASHLWEQAPTLLMGVVLGGSAVATYETAKRVAMVGSYLATCINDPLLVKISAMDTADEDVLDYVRLAIDYTPSVAIPAVFLMAPVASELLLVAAGPEYATAGLVLLGVASIHVLSGVKTPIAAAIHGVDRPRYVFYLTAATLVAGVPAVVLGAAAGGVEGVVLALVALELAGVVGSEVAARYAFGRVVLPETFHLQFGAAAAAGALVWAASHALDVTPVSTLGPVLAVGTAVHFGLFALASEQFRAGSVRTLRDLSGFLGARTSV